jgi:hypothetical protein
MVADMADCSREQHTAQAAIDPEGVAELDYSGYKPIECSIAGAVMDVAADHREDEGRRGAGRVYSSTAGGVWVVDSAVLGILWKIETSPRMAVVKPHIEEMQPPLWPTCVYHSSLTFPFLAQRRRNKICTGDNPLSISISSEMLPFISLIH